MTGLSGSGQAMGLIPLGTANVAALELGLVRSSGTDWDHVLQTLLNGRRKALSIGRARTSAGERLFTMMVGVGFDATAVANVDLGIKKKWGKLSYLLSGLAAWWNYSSFKLSVNECSVISPWLVVTNGKHYAGPYKISDTQSIFARQLLALSLIHI